ncbi:protein eyes shut homolog isoform X2 [Microplitis demolitor]|nr:protein eyes shut homolog isoform X2 [Microplitis demolitor]
MYCEDDEDCITDHAICSEFEHRCTCEEHYITVNDTTCVPVIGGFCKDDSECTPDNSVCLDNECRCKNKFIAVNNQECAKIYLDLPCEEDGDCYDVNRAMCSENKICTCKQNSIANTDGLCISLIEGFCEKDHDCLPLNSVCMNNKCQCKRSFISSFNKECVLSYLNQSCKNDQDCHDTDRAMCSEDKICVCRPNHLALNNSTCVSVIGGFCWRNEDCSLRNSICIFDKCRCKPDYSAQSNHQCVRKLGIFCERDEDCEEVRHTKCSENKTCVCRDNNVLINDSKCVPVLGGFCWKNEVCAATNSLCINNECQCKANFVPESKFQCIKAMLGNFCEVDTDCQEVLHSQCSKNKTCVCSPNHIALNFSRCAPLLEEYCWSDEECATINSVCLHSKCQCKHNYIAHSNNLCESRSLGKRCTDNKECMYIVNAECSRDNECVCSPNYIRVNNQCKPLLSGYCMSQNECVPSHSICLDYQCRCKGNFVALSIYQCASVQVNEPCNTHEDCRKIKKYTQCTSNKVCECRYNYVKMDDNSCAPILNQFCFDNDKCAPSNSICINNKCQCKTNFEAVSHDECLPSLLGMYCEDNEDCITDHAICSEFEHKCTCEEHYITVNDTTCVPVIGGFCKDDSECMPDNSVCLDNECRCKNNFTSVNNQECIKIYLDLPCEEDGDCYDVNRAMCSENKICTCKQNSIVNTDRLCISLIEGFCEKDHDCLPLNSVCLNNKCQCKRSFVSSFNKECALSYLNQSCKNDQDCHDTDRAMCSEDKICVCRPNHLALNNSTCVSVIGGFCWRNEDCSLRNSICIFDKCRCKPDYKAQSNHQCVPKLGKFCELDEDCEEIRHTKCSKNKTCVCRDNNVAINDSKCVPVLGGFCWKNEVCAATNSLCINNECQCKANFVPESKFQCIKAMLGKFCETDVDCQEVMHSQCSKNKTCVCRPNHIALNFSRCAPLLEEYCWSDEECATINSVCLHSKCQCKHNYIAHSNNLCESRFLGKRCTENKECPYSRNAECSKDNLCVCSSNSIEVNEQCKPLLSGYCTSQNKCVPNNSICLDYQCRCKKNFVASSIYQCAPDENITL